MGKFCEVAETMRTSNRNTLVFFICFMFMSPWNIYQVHCQDDSNMIDEFDANEEYQDVEIYDDEEIVESEELVNIDTIEDEVEELNSDNEDYEEFEIVFDVPQTLEEGTPTPAVVKNENFVRRIARSFFRQ